MTIPAGAPATTSVVGRIKIDVSGFQRDTAAITAAARASGAAITKAYDTSAVQRELDALRASVVKATNTTPVTSLGQAFKGVGDGIREAQGALLAFGAVSGATAFVGLTQADSVELLKLRYEELTGSQEAAAEQMARIGAAAQRVGVPIRQAQRDFLGLIPAVRDAGGSIEEYVSLALRLSTINPTEGVTGAVFAIREALSSGGTDLVSLAERFNLPRAQLRALIAETGDFAEALDIILTRQGATQRAADAQSRSLGALANSIRGTVAQILERTFLPLLESVRGGLEAFNRLLQETPEWVTSAAVGFVTIGGAFALLVVGLEKVITAYGAVKAAALSTAAAVAKSSPLIAQGAGALGSVALRGGVAVGAVAVGANVGLGLTQAIGRATGNESMANASFESIWLTARQLIFLAVYSLSEIIKQVGYALADVITLFQNFNAFMTIISAGLKSAFADLILGLAVVVKSIGDIVGQGESLSRPVFDEGFRLRDEANAERDAAQQTFRDARSNARAQVDSLFAGFQRAARDFLLPVETATEAVAEVSRSWVEDFRDGLRETITNVLIRQGDEAAAQADERVALLQRLTALEGQSLDSLAERVASLRDEQSALETVAGELEKFAPTSEAAAQKLSEYRQRIVQIGDELPQYADALKAATREALSEAADTYREALGEAEAKRADALKAAEAKRDEALQALDDERADQRVEAERKALSVEADFNQAVETAREAHRRRLQAIDEQFDKDSELAASELNAAGVAAAIERRNAERASADEALSDAELSASERRDTERAALAQELSDFAAAQEERRAAIFAAAAEERAAAQANFSTALTEAQAAYDAQRQAATSAQALALQDLRAAGDAERQVRRAALDQFAADSLTALQTLVESGRNVLAGLIASAGVAAQPSFATAASGSTLGILPNAGGRSVAATINVNGATDPEEVAEQVRRTMIRVAQGF